MIDLDFWRKVTSDFISKGVTLVAVSKTKPVEDILALYNAGQRDFGENYVQELVEKQTILPSDIRWHFIGHLQGNKVKYIAPFVSLIHAIDSYKLLVEINKYAQKNNRIIDVLLQIFIADEETKFGLDEPEIIELLDSYRKDIEDMKHIRICGLMGMATNSSDERKIQGEFARLHNFFQKIADSYFQGVSYFSVCSMGMSADYEIAIKEGSNMVRIGSLLFGSR